MKYYIYDYDYVSKMFNEGIVPECEILFKFVYDGNNYFINEKERIQKDKRHSRKCISEFSEWIRQFNRHRKYILSYSNICLLENNCYDLLSDYLSWEIDEGGKTYAEKICTSKNVKKTIDEVIKSLAGERLDVLSKDLFLEIENEGNDDGLDIKKVKNEIQKVDEDIRNKKFRWMLT